MAENPIKWISKKAKELRRKHPRENWSALIKRASQAYRAGHTTVKKAVKKTRKRRTVKRTTVKSLRGGSRPKRIAGTRPPGARITKHRSKKGTPPPIAWYIVKQDNKGFVKRGRSYITLGSNRRIVWQTWDEKEAKKYLKEHCLKSK